MVDWLLLLPGLVLAGFAAAVAVYCVAVAALGLGRWLLGTASRGGF